jgi:hypothetical protein
MKRNSVLAFFAAFLFLLVGIFNFIDHNAFRGTIGIIGALSFLLAGIHWGRTR